MMDGKEKQLVVKNTFLQEMVAPEDTLMIRGTSAPASMPKKDYEPVRQMTHSLSGMCSLEEHPEEHSPDGMRHSFILDQVEISRLLTDDVYAPVEREFPAEISRLQTGDVLPPPSPRGDNGIYGGSGLQTWQHTDFDLSRGAQRPTEVSGEGRDEMDSFLPEGDASPPSPPELMRLATWDFFGDNCTRPPQREQVGPMMQRLQQEHESGQVSGQLPSLGQMAPMLIPYGGPSQSVPPVGHGAQWAPTYVQNVQNQMPPSMERTVVQSGEERITWSVDARKLRSTDKQIVSPTFYVLGMVSPFKLLLFPVVASSKRGGASFKNSGGKGFVEIKCEGAPSGNGFDGRVPLLVRFFVGSQQSRGPIVNDFHEQPVCGLQQNVAHWDLAASAERGTIVIGIEVMRQTERV